MIEKQLNNDMVDTQAVYERWRMKGILKCALIYLSCCVILWSASPSVFAENPWDVDKAGDGRSGSGDEGSGSDSSGGGSGYQEMTSIGSGNYYPGRFGVVYAISRPVTDAFVRVWRWTSSKAYAPVNRRASSPSTKSY